MKVMGKEEIKKDFENIQKEKPIFLILVLLALLVIIVKSTIILIKPPFFNMGGDISRHIALIERTLSSSHVEYFHLDGSPGAYLYYPPGIHLLYSQLNLMTGLSIENIIIAMSVFSFVFFILLSYTLTKKFIGEKEGIYALLISSLFFSILDPAPFHICLYVFFPVILFLIMSYFKNKSLNTLSIFCLLTVGLAITHYSYTVLILITSTLLIIFLLFRKENLLPALNVWIVTMYSCTLGLILYSFVTPNLSTAITFHTIQVLRNIPIISSLIDKHPLHLLIAWSLVCAFIYIILRYSKSRINIGISTERISKVWPKNLTPFQAFFLFAIVVTIVLNLVNLSMFYLVDPSIPFFAREIGINFVTSFTGLHRAAFKTFLSLNVCLPALYFFTVTFLKKNYREIKINDLILISFIAIPLLLMPFALFNESFLTNSPFAIRMPLYGILPAVVFSSIFLKQSDQKKRVEISIILIFAFALIFSSLNPILVEPENELSKGYYWLINSTNIYADESAFSPHYSKFKQVEYVDITYDTKGYYHLSKFPKSYKNDFLDLKVDLLQGSDNEYTPLLKIGKKQIHLKKIKYKPLVPFDLSNKIYCNSKITFKISKKF